MIWATVSSQSGFCWLSRASPSLAAKNISIWFWYWPSGDVHVYSLLLCCWKRVFSMTSLFSWQNSISLCPPSFLTPRPKLLVTPDISWLPNFGFQSPIMKRTFLCVLVLEGLVGLQRTVQLQLLQHYCLGHRLGLSCNWMVCLGKEQRSLCHFWDCISDSFVEYDSYSISSKEFLPTAVYIMIIWVKFTYSSLF